MLGIIFIRLALYTGARKRNVLTMKWSDIDFTKKIWHIKKTKNGKPQDVPLTDDAMEILQGMKVTSKWVLPSDTSKSGHLEKPEGTWHKICAKAGIENLRIHDLRRTLASCLADFGASQHTIGIVLNHDDLKTTSIYARVSLEAVRQCMAKVTQMMNECTNAMHVNVTCAGTICV
ncbi:site-specific integrase [Candidatus Orientia mediorientalis]|nr:site-specific integrase [Candidatus Orientia mediorientalis]